MSDVCACPLLSTSSTRGCALEVSFFRSRGISFCEREISENGEGISAAQRGFVPASGGFVARGAGDAGAGQD